MRSSAFKWESYPRGPEELMTHIAFKVSTTHDYMDNHVTCILSHVLKPTRFLYKPHEGDCNSSSQFFIIQSHFSLITSLGFNPTPQPR